MKEKRVNVADLVLIAATVAVALVMMIGWFLGGSSCEAVIYLDGKEYARIELEGQVREVSVNGVTVCVGGGAAYVKESACPDKLCEGTGKISRKGGVIACVPNGVVIAVEEKDGSVDGITG